MNDDRRPRRSPPVEQRVVDWLLEEEQPAVRYRALLDLEGKREADREVRVTRSRIPRTGWVADQLRAQGSNGFWESRGPKTVKEWVDFLYFPVYRSTIWRSLVVSELGLEGSHPAAKKIADLLYEFKLRLSSPVNFYHEEVCASGNVARVLTCFGHGDDRRIRMLYDWLLQDQRRDGGWNCSQGTPGTLDVWEPLAAFAAIPKAKRSSEVESAIARGAEFYLSRRLFREGRPYAPWLRLHYPNHYFYDILVGLDLLANLGFAGDRRLQPALEKLTGLRRSDGTWWIDRSHPDVGGDPRYMPPGKHVRPLIVEPPGRPSKWITLKALRVLQTVAEAR